MRRCGFTLLEVLVASVLMGMLVTILTMIFNQSAIAWRTGKSGVSEMVSAERQLSRVHFVADNALPFNGVDNYCVVSPWDDSNGNVNNTTPNIRGIRKVDQLEKKLDQVKVDFYKDNGDSNKWKQRLDDATARKSESAFIVGVRSWGPDRKPDTDDDISTWPEK